MKKFLIAFLILLAGFSSTAFSAAKNINEKLIREFKETYPDAVQVDWREYPETYTVNFDQGKVKVSIIFNKDGSFISSSRYYKEENLPYYLVAAIRERFPEKKIYGVTEVSTASNIGYYIKLQDAKTWMTVKLDSEGNIRIVEKFRKA
jgi:ABC-type glycerol-3-phosphate transport system substrate-binding protein